MIDSFSLQDMIGLADQNNRMAKAILRAFINIGGDMEDVRCFVNMLDRPGGSYEKHKLTEFVKSVMNERLWSVAEQRVSIGAIDYKPSLEEFVKLHYLQNRIDLPQGVACEDQAVSGDFTYSLKHEERSESLWIIAKKYAERNVQVANWRELYMYGMYLQENKIDLKEYEIFAFGSSFEIRKGAFSYPYLRMKAGPDWRQVSFVWESLKDFPPTSRRRFYLVRHSSASST